MGNKTLELRFCVLGLDKAGKTTILYSLVEQRQIKSTLQTIGHNVETFQYHGAILNCWDVGGQVQLRPQWLHYLKGTQGLVYVVDSSDPERFDTAASELEGLLEREELKGVPVLVLANKQDLSGASSPAEVRRALALSTFDQESLVHGTTGWDLNSLGPGFKWLVSHAKDYSKGKSKKKKKKKKNKTDKMKEGKRGGDRKTEAQANENEEDTGAPVLRVQSSSSLISLPTKTTDRSSVYLYNSPPATPHKTDPVTEKAGDRVEDPWLTLAEAAAIVSIAEDELEGEIACDDSDRGANGEWRIRTSVLNVWLDG